MKQKILFLDGLRGLAALYVLIGHARWLLWEGYNEGYSKHPHLYSLSDKIMMYALSPFKWGHECVLFFFVLSGFVIHLGFSKKLIKDPASPFDVKEYLFKRAKRIMPPFIFALCLTMALDFTGKLLHFSIYSGTTPYSSINQNLGNSKNDIVTFLGNILFLYKQYVPLFGTNGPAWSLKLEWWFYLLYPLFIFISRKHIYYATGVIFLLFIASFFPAYWPEKLLLDVFSYMASWWLGVLLAEIATGRIRVSFIQSAVVSFLVGAALAVFAHTSKVHDFAVAFLFTSMLSFLLWFNEKGKRFKPLEKLKGLGDFSYTLYIIHFPILVFLSGFVMSRAQNTLPTYSYFVLAGASVCILIAYFVHFLVEVPFIKPSSKNMLSGKGEK